MITEFLQHLQYHHWAFTGVILVILEIFVPGAIFLWLGIAAGIVAGILFLIPDLNWQMQFTAFAVLSVLSVIVGRTIFHGCNKHTGDPVLNLRGRQYLNRTFVLEEPIVNGVGRVKVDDTIWRVRGPDCDSGNTVRVIDMDGTILIVECNDE
jgi:membrane protein implicated in regulation of membrane protease activity